MHQELVTTPTAASESFAEMPISEIAERLERRLRALYAPRWPNGNLARTETIKASVIVHYGPPATA